jgi:hypothetical protein
MLLVKRLATTATALFAFGAAASGCGGSDTPSDSGAGSRNPACGRCEEPNHDVDLSTPPVSFATTVFPILRGSCTATECHGTAPGTDPKLVYPALDLYLGPPESDTTTPLDAALYARLVGGLKKVSRSADGRALVFPGAPEKSFLVDKIYACQDERKLSCEVEFEGVLHCPEAACGDPMPPRDQPGQLSAEQKDAIRRWIAQGAQDN